MVTKRDEKREEPGNGRARHAASATATRSAAGQRSGGGTRPAATTHAETAHRETAHQGTAHPGTAHLDVADMGRRLGGMLGAVRVNLPPRDRMVYYGGLGLAVAAGMVDLPVGVAIGAGVWIATRHRPDRHPDGGPDGVRR